MRRIVIVLVSTAVLAACGGASGGGAAPSAAAPQTAAPVADCVDPKRQAAEGATVAAGDGVTVDALVQGSGTTGIVFSNMSEGDLCQWLPTADVLAAQGYRTAVYNYSDRQGPDADLVAVAGELTRRGARRVVLVGASKGGTTSIVAAARVHAAAVFELSAPATYNGLDASAAVPAVTVPSWFGVGEEDTDFVDSARQLYAASRAARKHLEIVPSAAHGTDLLGGPVDAMLTDFLRTNAPAAGA